MTICGMSESRIHEKIWFQDYRTGCEKQAHYFVRIRKLQDELINREQHNLINAMERLRQINNPRRKPGLVEADVLPRSSQSFPSRPLNYLRKAKHKAFPRIDKPDLKPLAGKPLMPEREKTYRPSVHPFFALPLLTDTDIAKIVHNASGSFTKESSSYLLQPHLPSIPNAGRKANFVLDNRMRLLTLAGSDPEFSEGNVIGTTKKMHKGKCKKKEGWNSSEKKSKSCSTTENINREQQVLRFDIDLSDASIFTHTLDETQGNDEELTTLLPPPNSRPSSTKLKDSQFRKEVAVDDDHNIINTAGETMFANASINQGGFECDTLAQEHKGDERSSDDRLMDQSITYTEQSADVTEQTQGESVTEPVSAEESAEITERLKEKLELLPVTNENQVEEADNLVEREKVVETGKVEVAGDITVINPEQVEELVVG